MGLTTVLINVLCAPEGFPEGYALPSGAGVHEGALVEVYEGNIGNPFS